MANTPTGGLTSHSLPSRADTAVQVGRGREGKKLHEQGQAAGGSAVPKSPCGHKPSSPPSASEKQDWLQNPIGREWGRGIPASASSLWFSGEMGKQDTVLFIFSIYFF